MGTPARGTVIGRTQRLSMGVKCREVYRRAFTSCAIVVAMGVFGWSGGGTTHAAQISPNPNYFNTITIGASETAENLVSFTNYGEIANAGTLNNSGHLNTYNIDQGDGLFGNTGIVNNTGTFSLEGASLSYLGVANNGGTFNNYSVTYVAYEGLFVNMAAGSVHSTANAQFNFFGSVQNFGLFNNSNGSVSSGGVYGLGSSSFLNGSTGTVTNAALSLFQSYGAVTNDGTFNNHGVAAFLFDTIGTFNNNGTFTNSSSGTVYNSTQVFNNGTATLTNSGTFENTNSIQNDATVTNSGTFTNSSQFTNNSSLINNGTFTNQSFAVLSISASASMSGTGSYVQTDSYPATTHVDGTMSQTSISIKDGILSGTGTVTATAGSVVLDVSAVIRPGNSAGTLSFGNSLDLEGTYEAEITELSGHDLIVVTGTATLGTESVLHLEFDYQPALNQTFDLIEATIGSGSFTTITFYVPNGGGGEGEGEGEGEGPPPEGDFEFSANWLTDELGATDVLRVTVTSVPVVPEPRAIALLGLGGMLLVRLRASAKR